MTSGYHRSFFRYQTLTFPLTLSAILMMSACDKPPPAAVKAPPPSTATENTAPFANAGEDITSKRNLTITLDGSNSNDIDGGDLTYQWRQISGPSVELKDADTATPHFLGPKSVDSLEFSLVVNDGQADSTADTVVVNFVRSAPPQIDTAPLIRVQRDEHVKLSASQTQTSELPTSIEWQQTYGKKVTLEKSDTLTPTFTAPNQSGYLIFKVIARDSDDGEGHDSIAVEINNRAPIAHASAAQEQVTPGSKVSLSASNSQDPEGDVLSYRWKQILGNKVSLNNADTVSPYFDAPDFADHLVFSLSVSDGEFSSHLSKVHIKVKAVTQRHEQQQAQVVLSTTNSGPIAIDVNAKPSTHDGNIKWDTNAISDQQHSEH